MDLPLRVSATRSRSCLHRSPLGEWRTYQLFAAQDRVGVISEQRVVLTDGGVYDNPASYAAWTVERTHRQHLRPDHVISCDAGRGQLGDKLPFHMLPRVSRAFEASFRKLQDASRGGLHEQKLHGELAGFVMPYLSRRDERSPWAPPDLVPHSAVAGYPLDLASHLG